MSNSITDSFWLRLDNAAKIYPAVQSKDLTCVFRITAELKARVKAQQIIEAVHAIENRFPYYKVKLKTGFFWYYLEHLDSPITIEPDCGALCRAFEKDRQMVRVLVKSNSISVEFSHILTDGSGAFEFLKTLLLTYFEKCGIPIPATIQYEHSSEPLDEEKQEDAFKRYFQRIKSSLATIPDAFHVPSRTKAKTSFSLLKAEIPLDIILGKAKEYNVSLTEYLTAVYIHSLQEIYEQLPAREKKKSNKYIRIEVPVNLRRMFASRTMRNFSLFVMPGIDLRLGHYTFDEIVKTVYHQMRLETEQKLIKKIIARNVGGEKIPILRGMPLVLKSIFLSWLFHQSIRKYSGVVTNYGKVDFTPPINNCIERFLFIPPPPNKTLKVNCGVVGFENKLIVNFGSIADTKELERKFLTYLTGKDIPVKIFN